MVRRHTKIRAHDLGKGKSGRKQEGGPSFFPFYFLVRSFFSSFCDYLGPWNRLSSHVNGGIRNDVRNASKIYNSKSFFFKEPLNLHYNEIKLSTTSFLWLPSIKSLSLVHLSSSSSLSSLSSSLSSSSLVDRRAVDCKSSPTGSVLVTAHNVILWQMLIGVDPFLGLAGYAVSLGVFSSGGGGGAHTTGRC